MKATNCKDIRNHVGYFIKIYVYISITYLDCNDTEAGVFDNIHIRIPQRLEGRLAAGSEQYRRDAAISVRRTVTTRGGNIQTVVVREPMQSTAFQLEYSKIALQTLLQLLFGYVQLTVFCRVSINIPSELFL